MFLDSKSLLENTVKEFNCDNNDLVLNKKKYNHALQNAKIMDGLAKEIRAMYFDIKINDDYTLEYSLYSYDISISNKINKFYELVRCSNHISFSSIDNELLVISFNMPSVWDFR